MSRWQLADLPLPEVGARAEIAPDRVVMAFAESGDIRPLSRTWPQVRSGGVRSVSVNGILGDPARANAADGRVLLGRLAGKLADDVAQWRGEVPA